MHILVYESTYVSKKKKFRIFLLKFKKKKFF